MARLGTVASASARISEAMDLRGMRQVELVEKSGLSKSLVNQYVSGKIQNVRSDKIYILAKALSVDPVWLMGFDVPMEEQTAKDKAQIDAQITSLPEFRVIAEGYLNAPDSVKEAILTLLKPYVK